MQIAEMMGVMRCTLRPVTENTIGSSVSCVILETINADHLTLTERKSRRVDHNWDVQKLKKSIEFMTIESAISDGFVDFYHT
jgi:pyridoxine 5'-phosphate synthase PdxJ